MFLFSWSHSVSKGFVVIHEWDQTKATGCQRLILSITLESSELYSGRSTPSDVLLRRKWCFSATTSQKAPRATTTCGSTCFWNIFTSSAELLSWSTTCRACRWPEMRGQGCAAPSWTTSTKPLRQDSRTGSLDCSKFKRAISPYWWRKISWPLLGFFVSGRGQPCWIVYRTDGEGQITSSFYSRMAWAWR